MFLRKKTDEQLPPPEKLPRHIAIIMDGNGRWAQRRLLPRKLGHKAGAERFRDIALCCQELGAEYLTVFAFSTENFRRPADEVEGIMNLLRGYMSELCSRAAADGMRVRFPGRRAGLPEDVAELIADAEAATAQNRGICLNICVNYGGRADITDAAREFARSGESPDSLTEERFARLLSTGGEPDPDLLIKTGGEFRVSNFLLWQLAYTEMYFTDVLWPDFTRAELKKALVWYAGRSRRFGGLK